MDPQSIDYLGWILKIFTVSGGAAFVAMFLTNKRGENKFIDFILDMAEAIAFNMGKASNDKTK